VAGEVMNQYIITEEDRDWIIEVTKGDMCWNTGILEIMQSLHPYQSERDKVLKNIMELVDARIIGLDNLLATPSEQRTESAQDKYLKEARFELGLVQDEYKKLRQAGEP
jgi:hypothetical protein